MKTEILPDLASNWSTCNDIYKMIDECKRIGLKFAKLQLFKKNQVRDVYWNNILTKRMAEKAFIYGKSIGIEVYFTPCYPEAVDICKNIGVNYYKIRFKDRNNPDIFEKMQDIYKPIFVSCQNPKDTLYYGMKNIIFLYCVHKYPAKPEEYNLSKAIRLCRGVSDHTSDMGFFGFCGSCFQYWEMHMALRKGTLEEKWSKTFKEVEKYYKL